MTLEAGLYVVATPIGNLGDLSPRAMEVLRAADWVGAEDTRVSQKLLTLVASRARMIAVHEHNESSAAERIVALLDEGKLVALVSDAGTPAVSDPGARVVAAVRAAGHRVIPVPGPSAVLALLSASGLVDDGSFLFAGFLPSRARARAERLAELGKSASIVVIFESPHRIAATLGAIAEVLGPERTLVLGRELTKKFEEIVALAAGEASGWLAADANRERGEYAIAIAPAAKVGAAERDQAGGAMPVTIETSLDQLLRSLLAELPPSRAARLAESLTGLPHRAVYPRTLELAKTLASE